jgi:hypothetical protein
MKPTFQFPEPRSRRGACFPKTDYCFRPSMRDFGGRSHGDGSPSFRRISATYFDSGEARNHFASEAGFFALIVITAAVPVAKAIGGLFHFVQSVSVL